MRHPHCGLRGPSARTCLRCDMVAAYLARRSLYLDAVDDSDPADLRWVPITPVVTFGWWLRSYEWPRPEAPALVWDVAA